MKYINYLLFSVIVLFSSCGFNNERVEPVLQSEFHFDEDEEGWAPGYANYDPALEDSFRFEFGHTKFAFPNGDSATAIYQTSYNANSKLFIYIKRKIGGLEPNTSYKLVVGVDFYCQLIEPFNGDLSANSIGSYLKIGAFTDEPVNMVVQDSLSIGGSFIVTDFDPGNNDEGGESVVYAGKIIQTKVNEDPQLLAANNSDNPIILTSDAGGNIWVVVGINTNVPLYQRVYYRAIGCQIQKVAK